MSLCVVDYVCLQFAKSCQAIQLPKLNRAKDVCITMPKKCIANFARNLLFRQARTPQPASPHGPSLLCSLRRKSSRSNPKQDDKFIGKNYCIADEKPQQNRQVSSESII